MEIKFIPLSLPVFVPFFVSHARTGSPPRVFFIFLLSFLRTKTMCVHMLIQITTAWFAHLHICPFSIYSKMYKVRHVLSSRVVHLPMDCLQQIWSALFSIFGNEINCGKSGNLRRLLPLLTITRDSPFGWMVLMLFINDCDQLEHFQRTVYMWNCFQIGLEFGHKRIIIWANSKNSLHVISKKKKKTFYIPNNFTPE